MISTVSFVGKLDEKRRKKKRIGWSDLVCMISLNNDEEASNGKSKFEGIAEFEDYFDRKIFEAEDEFDRVIAKLAADGKDNIVTKSIEGLRVSIPKDARQSKGLSYL